MFRTVSLTLTLAAFLHALPAFAITIPTVPVANAGNANDVTGLGAVASNYRIGTTEVTVGQYATFLNAVAATDTYSLYSPFMASDPHSAGIARGGSPGSYTYSVIGSSSKPISYVNLGDAYRFSNWLHNGQPSGLQNAGTTEDGAYVLNGATSMSALNAVTRSLGAKWFVPSENEWYKAAYYNPAASSYFQYPTSSNTAPTSAPPGSTPNTANFYSPTTGYAVTGSTTLSPTQNYLSDVGTYTNSASPYGTFDQGGNLAEWYQGVFIGSTGLPGGWWTGDSSLLLSSVRTFPIIPTVEDVAVGFRVATVPEPASIALAVLGFVSLLARGWRRRKH